MSRDGSSMDEDNSFIPDPSHSPPFLNDVTPLRASSSRPSMPSSRSSIAISTLNIDMGSPSSAPMYSHHEQSTSTLGKRPKSPTIQESWPPSDTEPQPIPTRHKTFWMYDGSIVLRVENTLFRVHQTVLATHSEIFADLFTVPQPLLDLDLMEGLESQMVDGCHVVSLYDDGEKDFEDLLNAVYIPDHFSNLPHDADLDTLLNFVAGILRLATKYMIRHLRQRCIALLHTKFPCTFEGYEAKSAASISSATSPAPGPITPDRYRSDTVMRAIALAQELNIPSILPYAYYCLSRFPHRRFLKQRAGDISWQTKTIVLIGRERLGWAQASISHSFLLVFRRSPLCVGALCAHSRGPHAEWHELEKGRSPHPLRRYEGWPNLNVCKECVGYCQTLHDIGRREVWKYLPGWFELPEWDELKETQER